jgi:hypothetical protein
MSECKAVAVLPQVPALAIAANPQYAIVKRSCFSTLSIAGERRSQPYVSDEREQQNCGKGEYRPGTPADGDRRETCNNDRQKRD